MSDVHVQRPALAHLLDQIKKEYVAMLADSRLPPGTSEGHDFSTTQMNKLSELCWQLVELLGESNGTSLFVYMLNEVTQSRGEFRADASVVDLRISEEPLTLSTFSRFFPALTELATKYWFIAQGRADLIEDTQTRNERFVEEADLTIGTITHNSPVNVDIQINPAKVAEALVTIMDSISQRRAWLEKAELENQAEAHKISQTKQQSENKQQLVEIELEKQRLNVEERRLELIEKRLTIRKNAIKDVVELASLVIETIRKNAWNRVKNSHDSTSFSE